MEKCGKVSRNKQESIRIIIFLQPPHCVFPATKYYQFYNLGQLELFPNTNQKVSFVFPTLQSFYFSPNLTLVFTPVINIIKFEHN